VKYFNVNFGKNIHSNVTDETEFVNNQCLSWCGDGMTFAGGDMMIKKLLIAFNLLPLLLLASGEDSLNNKALLSGAKTSYSWVFFSAGYRMPVTTGNVINSGRGVYVEAGVNAGRAISENVLVGLFGGWGWKDNLWVTGFKNQFVKDYAASINHEKASTFLDSSIISSSAGLFNSKKGRSAAMPGCEMRSFNNYSMYYGAIIKLPFRFTPAFKIYHGSARSHYQGPDGIVTSGNDYNIFQLRRSMYGAELMFTNPLRIFYKKAAPSHIQKLGLSVYYEYCDFYTAALYFDDGQDQRLISLKSFVSKGLLKKYAHEDLFGFKVSYNLY
jgi:hypothetical protein